MDAKQLLLSTQEAIKRVGTISDDSEAYRAIDASFRALRKTAEYLDGYDIEGAGYCPECGRKGISFEAAGKVAACISKVTNDTVRLMELYKGNADSRADTSNGMADLVKGLTSEQLATVLKWMDENAEPKQDA